MKVFKQGSTAATVVRIGTVDLLFSYDTLVAADIMGKGAFRTSDFHSVSTSRHINNWLKELGREAEERSQEWFDRLTQTITFDFEALEEVK